MSKYLVEIKKSVKKDLKHIPLTERREIMNLIENLSDNPRPPGCKKLKVREFMYRIRFKNYRILYEIHDDIITVIVIRVAHRKNVYR